MPPQVLYPVYLLVMGAAAACFLRAYRLRHDTPRHVRAALTGVALDLAGTLVVIVLHRGLGWSMPAASPALVFWHRRAAYVSSGLMLLVAFLGWRRHRVHPVLAVPFVPLYLLTLVLAILGYWPY